MCETTEYATNDAIEKLRQFEADTKKELAEVWKRRKEPRQDPYSGLTEDPPSEKWDNWGLGEKASEKIFAHYSRVKLCRLSPEKITAEGYAGAKKVSRSYLSSPEIKVYDMLVAKLERLLPDPPWKSEEAPKKEKGDTRIREKQPAPV